MEKTVSLPRSSVRLQVRRFVWLLCGLTILGLGIAIQVRAGLGLGPWDVLHQGISNQTGISIGTVIILVGLPIMLLWLPLGERPGFGTIANVFGVGIAADLFLNILPVQTWLPAQLGQLVFAVAIMGVGSGLYLSAGMGAGPRDGVMMGLVRRTGWSVRLIRTLLEVSVLAIGWLLGGSVGLGTVVFALGIGPAVQITLRVLRRFGGQP